MTNEDQAPGYTPEQLARARRQMADRAVNLAVANRWDEAVAINREYVRLFPEDSDGFNRLGKSLAETSAIAPAREAYQRALELDPTNTIARRNLDRLQTLASSGTTASRSTVDTRMFVEETGKAAVAQLQAVDSKVVGGLDAGDVVNLSVDGNAVNVTTIEGAYLGMVSPRLGLRLGRLMSAGNRYTAALLTTGEEIRIIVRETFQHPSQASVVSFPQSKQSDFRPYMRASTIRSGDRLTDIEQEDDDYDGDNNNDDEESWENSPRGMRLVASENLDDDYD